MPAHEPGHVLFDEEAGIFDRAESSVPMLDTFPMLVLVFSIAGILVAVVVGMRRPKAKQPVVVVVVESGRGKRWG